MATVNYKQKVALIPPELHRLLISVGTKHATIRLSPYVLVPGQNFWVSWGFNWVSSKSYTKPPSINVQVLWHSYELYQTRAVPIIPWGTGYFAGESSRLIIIENLEGQYPGISNKFYKPEDKQIELRITWTGQDWDGKQIGTVSAFDWLIVNLADPVDDWWAWRWTSNYSNHVYMDESYSMAGTVTNKHKYADAREITANLWKWEDGHEGDKKVLSSRTPAPFSLAAGDTHIVDFGQFKDPWTWFDCDRVSQGKNPIIDITIPSPIMT